MSISVENLINGEGTIWGSPTYNQSRIGFEETKRALWRVAKFNESRMLVTLGNKEIDFISLDRPEKNRGKTAENLVLDEVQSIKSSAYHEVLRPMIMGTLGKLWAIGTSNGLDWFWRERMAAANRADSMTWNAPTLGVAITKEGELIREPHPLENPNIEFSEIKSMFVSQPRHVFRREILCDDSAAPGQLVYETWVDGYPENDQGNVTTAADFIPSGGYIYWFVDDGYTGRLDPETGYFTRDSHPRVFLLAQMRSDGRLCIFYESYKVKTQPDPHIGEILELGYEPRDYAVVDKSAAQLIGRMNELGVDTRRGPASVAESVKELHRWIAPDENGYRRLLVHPRCKQLRYEMVQYRNGDNGKPDKSYDHGPDAARYGICCLRYE